MRHHNRGRAAAALAWGLLFFVAAQAGLFAVMEHKYSTR